ncbi:hypothetical protein BCR33DRAFT_570673 [Rhizoclosmatium globosum]|uniref:Gti1/Pac2 family protein n=1 Tax=Rhizoclosmatium globosum TaxID=329046 RepID=A0A1Y2B5Z6_9FUNG|nr:hypothetical protein BCR33DRAFT_570673 [Rhizoclosmatium globosum]|eukprot:ORY30154.1 hypothetical protein BCR33DRAFT_570673 [Rhizoclosmatium globosum]
MDALFVVQGTVFGKLTPFAGTAEEMARIRIRSGTVIVMAENSPFVKRWRDGIRWSPSRAFGPFILYRQIENKDPNATTQDEELSVDILPPPGHFGSTTGVLPTYTERTLKPNTQLLKNGLTKRTISVKGSDGLKHRVVSYYSSKDVLEMKVRSKAPEAEVPEREGGFFCRAVDDPVMKTLVQETGINMVNLLKQTFADWKEERLSQTRRVSPPPSKQAVSSRPVRNQTGQRGQSEGLEGRQQPHFDNIKTPPKKEQLSLTSSNLANNHQNTSSSVLNPRRLYETMDLDGYYPYQDNSEDYEEFCARRSCPPVEKHASQYQQPVIQQSHFIPPPQNYLHRPPYLAYDSSLSLNTPRQPHFDHPPLHIHSNPHLFQQAPTPHYSGPPRPHHPPPPQYYQPQYYRPPYPFNRH